MSSEVDIDDVELYGRTMAEIKAGFSHLSDVQGSLEWSGLLKHQVGQDINDLVNHVKRHLWAAEDEYLLERFKVEVEAAVAIMNHDLQEIEDGHPGYPSKEDMDVALICDLLAQKLIFHDQTSEQLLKKNNHLRSRLVRAIINKYYKGDE